MKNLNEPLRRTPSEGEVISLESRRNAAAGTTQPIARGEIEDLRLQWTAIQASFVDEPRESVEKADELISSAIQRITDDLQSKRSELEKNWNKGDASTEDLRTSLQHYHALFDRLLVL
jgi:hypothetical protein